MNPFTNIYAVVIALVTAFALGGITAWKVQAARIDAVKAEYATFVAATKAAGDAAQQVATAKIESDKVAKRKADDEHKRTISRLHATVKRLRDANPPSSHLPPAPAATSRPDLICLDRAEYQREDGAALEKLFTGARSLADEGTKSTVDLDTAKRWAQ